jgi:hypothetical protein
MAIEVKYGPEDQFTEDVSFEELEAAEEIFDNLKRKGIRENGNTGREDRTVFEGDFFRGRKDRNGE